MKTMVAQQYGIEHPTDDDKRMENPEVNLNIYGQLIFSKVATAKTIQWGQKNFFIWQETLSWH